MEELISTILLVYFLLQLGLTALLGILILWEYSEVQGKLNRILKLLEEGGVHGEE